jgi:hypothetical protein
MPIYVSHKSLVFPGATYSSSLEELTGADVLLTPAELPISGQKLIEKHIESGAIMIQIKSGMDLIASLGPRLNDSIAGMSSINGVAPFQVVLLFVGVLDCTPAGFAIIDGEVTNHLYIAVISALDSWTMRGGTVMFIKNMSMVEEYLITKAKKMLEMLAEQTKEVYPPPLQLLVKVYDWRLTILTFPMIGEVRAKKIRDYLISNRLGDSLLQALVVMTNKSYSQGDSLSESVRQSCRGWLGLPDGWNINISSEEEPENL